MLVARYLCPILRTCPAFQVPSSHFSEFDDLLNEHWAKMCEDIVVQLQSMLNENHYEIICIDTRSLAYKKIIKGFKIFSFSRSIRTYGLVAKTSSSESGDMCLIPAGC